MLVPEILKQMHCLVQSILNTSAVLRSPLFLEAMIRARAESRNDNIIVVDKQQGPIQKLRRHACSMVAKK